MPSLIDRAKHILLQPQQAWATIDAERTDTLSLFKGYVMPLALIPALCGFVGMTLIGFGMFGVSVRLPLLTGLVNMLVSYAFSLAGVFVLGLIIDALAPTFGGQKSPIQALKVAAYSFTAAFVGGVFSLLPALSMLGLVAALYSFYLLYTGLPVLMKSAPDKSLPYTAVVVVAAIVMGVLMVAASSLFTRAQGPSLGLGGAGGAVSVSTPSGKVSVDMAGLEAAGKKMEEAARQMEKTQNSEALPAAALKASLPQELAGMPRTAMEVQDGAALGLPSSHASATYALQERQVKIDITDAGALGQMAALAAGMGQSEKEDEVRVEKTWQEEGRTLHQRYYKDGSQAEFEVVLKNGVVLSASASQMDVQVLRTLLSQVSWTALEALQRKAKS
jgi:hypothetical protein